MKKTLTLTRVVDAIQSAFKILADINRRTCFACSFRYFFLLHLSIQVTVVVFFTPVFLPN